MKQDTNNIPIKVNKPPIPPKAANLRAFDIITPKASAQAPQKFLPLIAI